MRLLIPFTFYVFFTHLGATKAIVFFHFPRSFQHPIFRPLSADQTNDEDSPIPPFPSFFSVFRHRNLNPFQNFWGDSIKTSIPESTTKDESKVNETENFKIDNITDQVHMKEASTLTPNHHILKKDIENSTKPVSLEKYYHPWRRFFSFQSTDLKPLLYNGRNRKDTRSLIKTNQNATQPEDYLKESRSNKAQVNGTKNFPVYEENCIQKHYISRYLFIWTINWASLAIHLTVVLLLSSLATIAIIFCRSCCCLDQSQSQALPKIKPLNV